MHDTRAECLSVRCGVRSLGRPMLATLTALLLLLSLGACDGGIFGTGDGSDIIHPDNAEGSDTDNGSTDGASGGATGGEEQPDAGAPSEPDDSDTGGSDVGEEAASEQRAFENLQAGSDRDVPLLSVINLSQSRITAFSDADAEALFAPAIQAGETSAPVAVPLSSQSLSVVLADTASLQLQLSPLNLGVSSVTTLIVRDRFADAQTDSNNTDPESGEPVVDILALPSSLSPSNDALARVRILQAYALEGDARTAQMLLLPAGNNPGGSEVSLGSVSPDSFQQMPDYREVTAGSYAVQDSLQRFTPVPLTLDEGQSYTLILTGSEAPIMIVQDSESPTR